MPEGDDPLDRLRREIDRIDDALHDLLIERAEVVQRVGTLKGRTGAPVFRPGREARILRRLTARRAGQMPPEVVVRIWREIISALIRLEGPFTVAVYAPAGVSAYRDLAQDHFGTLTPTLDYGSAGQVVSAVIQRQAAVGVLPVPTELTSAGDEAWWRNLGGEEGKSPRIVGRLPFGERGPARRLDRDALMIGLTAQEDTGDDRSYLLIDTDEETSRARLKDVLEACGIAVLGIDARAGGPGAASWSHLAEIEGFVSPGDPRLDALAKRLGSALASLRPLGGYAVPLGERAPSTAARK